MFQIVHARHTCTHTLVFYVGTLLHRYERKISKEIAEERQKGSDDENPVCRNGETFLHPFCHRHFAELILSLSFSSLLLWYSLYESTIFCTHSFSLSGFIQVKFFSLSLSLCPSCANEGILYLCVCVCSRLSTHNARNQQKFHFENLDELLLQLYACINQKHFICGRFQSCILVMVYTSVNIDCIICNLLVRSELAMVLKYIVLK